MKRRVDKRKTILEIASRHAHRGSGSRPEVLREARAPYATPDLRPHLGSVPFVVVGGLATRLYMPERMTLDTDVLVRAQDLVAAERALSASGCAKAGPLPVGGSTWRLPGGDPLDVIALDEPWVDAAIDNAVAGHDALPYVCLAYLVVMKLASGRVQDLADISRMLGLANEEDLAAARRAVQRYRPADTEDLESLIALGKMEHEEA